MRKLAQDFFQLYSVVASKVSYETAICAFCAINHINVVSFKNFIEQAKMF